MKEFSEKRTCDICGHVSDSRDFVGDGIAFAKWTPFPLWSNQEGVRKYIDICPKHAIQVTVNGDVKTIKEADNG